MEEFSRERPSLLLLWAFQFLGTKTRRQYSSLKSLQSPATLVPPMPPKRNRNHQGREEVALRPHFERLSAAMEKYEQGLGMMLVRGVKRGEDEDEDDEDEDDEDDEDEEHGMTNTPKSGVPHAAYCDH